jgi:fumarate reductase flavoprotein subunit
MRTDRDWLKRTWATWEHESSDGPTLGYEPLNIMKMELPPGFRGYGTDNTLPHPDTERRVAEVAAAKEAVAKEAGGDRFKLQETLMPYTLPSRYTGKNERTGQGVR